MKMAFKSELGKKAIIDYYDFLYDQTNYNYERFYIETTYGSTFITAYGDKSLPPLILLHGSGMNSIMWVDDIKKYSENFRVFAIDIIGEVGKSDEKRLPLKGPFYADWIKEVFDSLSIEKAIIQGISLGGWLAAKFTIAYPERVEKLVLLCPAGIGPQRTSFLFKSLAHMLLGERGMEILYQKIIGHQKMPQVMLEYQKIIGKHFNYIQEPIPLFSDDELKRLAMPTILFVGAKDIMFHSDKTAKRLGELVPHANINILPEAGHALINLVDVIRKLL